MFSRFAKISLVSTAFAPVLLTYAVSSWTRGDFCPWGWALVILSLLFVALCLLLIRAARSDLERIPFPVQSIKTADSEIVGFLIAYMLPLVNSGGDAVDPRILVFVLAVFVTVVWSSHSYHVNPLLGVLGYHFYEIETTGNVTYLLVTKQSLRRARTIQTVVQITDYMVLDASSTEDHRL